MSIKIHGIFRQDRRFCDKNEICDITFKDVYEFKKWVHENCNAVSDKYIYIDKEYGKIPESICGFLCEDSEYSISHRRGYAKVEIYIITETITETINGNPKAITNDDDDEDINEDEFPYIEKEVIIYSNGMKTDGNKHFGDKIEKILEEVNKNGDRSKFNFA